MSHNRRRETLRNIRKKEKFLKNIYNVSCLCESVCYSPVCLNVCCLCDVSVICTMFIIYTGKARARGRQSPHTMISEMTLMSLPPQKFVRSSFFTD